MLNQKQQEFVDCKTKKICLDGVPGSGKSHTLVAKLVSYVDMGIHPQRMMVCCFTNKATDSIRNRLLNKLAEKNMFYEPRDLWIGTIHSICYRIIREYIDYLKGYKEGVAIISWQKQLKIAEEILQLVRLHGVTPNGLLGQISFTKNDQEDIYNSKHFVKIQFRDAYMLYNERLKAQNLLDLDDLLLQCYELLKVPYVLKSLQNNFDCILVDEFQDVNWVQYKIFKTLADREDMHYVVFGDARQCLIKGTQINTVNGNINIENIKLGDKVICSKGHGIISAEGIVENIFKKKFQGQIFTIKTKSGKTISGTGEHIVFTKLEPTYNHYYVYLMYKKGMGYRIGLTRGFRVDETKYVNGVKVRNRQEGGDRIWIIKICNSFDEAKYYESYFSYYYGIPMSPFHTKGRSMKMCQNSLNKLFNDIDTTTRANKIMEDLHIHYDYPFFYAGAHISGNIKRKRLNITYFSGEPRGNSTGDHRMSINSSDEKLKNLLKEHKFNVRKGKRNTWRIEVSRNQYDSIVNVSDSILSLDNDIVLNERIRLLKTDAFDFTPLSHIQPNMIVAIYYNGELLEDIVESVSKEDYNGYVYDINIAHFRHYFANGICVHNCIYEWRGARPQYLIDFDKNVKDSERLFLELNYRCPPKVIDLSEEIIKNIEVNTTKVHKAVKTNVIDIPYDIYTDEVIEAINIIGRIIDLNTDLTECAILHRKQRQSRVFEEICRNFNIPYVVVGAYPFYQRKEVKDCLSFIKLLIGDRNDNDIINVINTPYRGIGEKTIEKLLAFKKPLWDVISNIESTNLPMNIKRTITSFKYMVTRLTVNNKKDFVEIRDKLYQLLDETMYIETEFARESEENQNERRGNVYELLNAIDNHMAEGHSIYEFYDFIMDFNSKQEDNNGIRIMTMHASKGLEFNNIFVAGFCDEHFIKGNYDEEIRLLYVAVTRTKEHLYLSGFGEGDIPSFVLKKCKHLITIKDHRDVSNKAIYGKTKELDLFSFRNIADVPRLEA